MSEAENYLADLGIHLKEEAFRAKARAREALDTPDQQFESGRLAAYHEVLSLLKQQALVFGVPDSAIGLNDFDPDLDLLSS